MRFAIPLHTHDRPRCLDQVLTSLEKNSVHKHDVFLAMDRIDAASPSLGFGVVGETNRDTINRWRDFDGDHVKVHAFEWHASAQAVEGTHWTLMWAEAMQAGVEVGDNEWVLIGAQDDMYFAPNWDINLIKHMQASTWLVPVTIASFHVDAESMVPLSAGAATGQARTYWTYLDKTNLLTKQIMPILDRRPVPDLVIRESDFCAWIAWVGLFKPGVTVDEPGGARIRAAFCPMLLPRALFVDFGGLALHKWHPHYNDLMIDLDDRLGAAGYSKRAAQDSFVLNAWSPIEFDPSMRGGPTGPFWSSP